MLVAHEVNEPIMWQQPNAFRCLHMNYEQDLPVFKQI